MLEVETAAGPDWPGGTDWPAIADRAARAAIAATPHAALLTGAAMIELSIRLTDDGEVQALNRDYRGKDKPTNVLSFPMLQPDLIDAVTRNSDDGEVLLGDIALAHGVCAAEAAGRGLALADHATHLVIHGTLHLLGYDHGEDAAAQAMEKIEQDVLRGLGLHDPYQD